MTPAIYTMRPVTRGDKWKGLPRIRIWTEVDAPAIPLGSVSIIFSKSGIAGRAEDSGSPFELSTENGTIIITSAIEWDITIPEQFLPLKEGTWGYRIKTTAADGDVQTYIVGTLKVR